MKLTLKKLIGLFVIVPLTTVHCASKDYQKAAHRCIKEGVFRSACEKNPRVLKEVAQRAQFDPATRSLVALDLKNAPAEKKSVVIIRDREEALKYNAQAKDGGKGVGHHDRIIHSNGGVSFPSYNSKGNISGMNYRGPLTPERRTGADHR